MRRLFFAIVLVTAFFVLPGCDQIDDVQQLLQQIAELQEINRKLEQEIMELNEKLSIANEEIESFRDENSRNLEQIFR